MLGLCVLIATAVAVLAVRPRASYLIIPVPALAYVVAAILAGSIHDHSLEKSHTALVITGVQWVASGFTPMLIATGLAIVVSSVRWLASVPRSSEPAGSRHRPARALPVPGPRPADRPAPDAGRAASISADPQAAADLKASDADRTIPNLGRMAPDPVDPRVAADPPAANANRTTPNANRTMSNAERALPSARRPGSQAGQPGPQTGQPGPQTGQPGPQTGEQRPQTGEPRPQADRPAPQADRPGPQADRPGPDSGQPTPTGPIRPS